MEEPETSGVDPKGHEHDRTSASVDHLLADAQAAAEQEHELSVLEAVSKYPSAVAWTVFFSLGVIMCVPTLATRWN